MSDLHTYKVMQSGDADQSTSMAPVTRGSGWVGGLTMFAVFAIAVVMLYPIFARPDDRGHRQHPLSNLKQLALANLMYASDYDDHMPPAATWMDSTLPYHKNESILHDPSIKDRKKDEYGFAFFEPVSGIDTRTLVDQDSVPMLFQSVLMGRNAHSDLSTLPAIPREKDVNYVASVDGHVKGMPPSWPAGPITIVIDPSLAKEPNK